MDRSRFLAKVMGLYLLILSIGVFFNKAYFLTMMNDMIKNPALLFLMGIFVLIIGILLVVSHNVWTLSWRVIITILSWIVFIKGIASVCCPQYLLSLSEQTVQNQSIWTISMAIDFILGLILCYYGFFASKDTSNQGYK